MPSFYNKLLGVAALLWAASILPAQAAPPALAPLHYEVHYLKNGLKIITLAMHDTPAVTVEVWYHVGSEDEPMGKHGFAHLFEHLMFKGTAHMAPGDWDHYINGVGGDDNADTYFDRTRYYETVPAPALGMTLWMEADRMANLSVNQPNMNSERNVVEEEHRIDVENAPYGRAGQTLQAMLFPPDHPYGHDTIGSMSDLNAATLADVQAFHAMYYRPDNATLVIVGDFKTKSALDMVREYFGGITRPASPPVRLPVPEVVQKEAVTKTITDPLAPLPQVTLAYRITPADSKDTPVFDVINTILSSGNSSRLYLALVKNNSLASSVDSFPTELKLSGWLELDAVPNQGVKPEAVQQALLQQIALLTEKPVTEEELEKARNQAVAQRVFGTINTQSIASALGRADLRYGDPGEVNHDLERIAKVSASDILRVAKKYFAPSLSNTLYVLPAPDSAGPDKNSSERSGK